MEDVGRDTGGSGGRDIPVCLQARDGKWGLADTKSKLLKQPQLRKEHNLQRCTARLCLENMMVVNEESTPV